ncbi:MAG: DNA polymerase III subunit delta [Akkermansia sp.]|nr:DNA polymerase III subunit delta [Akkermansia sp.]
MATSMQSSTVHLIFGSDDGLVSEKSSLLFGKLTEGTDEFSHEIIEGNVADSEIAEQTIHQTIEALCTLPFFGGLKVVWLKNCTFLDDSIIAKSASVIKALESLQTLLEKGLGEQVKLLISATGYDKRRSFNKFLISLAQCQEYNTPDITKDGWEESLKPIIRQLCDERGLSFEASALELFIHRVSESTRQIASDIEKLDIYLGQERRQITIEDVEIMVPLTRSGVIFEISRALESKNIATAIKLIDFQLERGENAIAIMRATFIPTIRNLLTARMLIEEFGLKVLPKQISNLPPSALGLIPLKKDGTPNIYPLFNAMKHAGKYNTKQLKKSLRECLRADRALVSSSLNPRLILHQLAIYLAS